MLLYRSWVRVAWGHNVVLEAGGKGKGRGDVNGVKSPSRKIPGDERDHCGKLNASSSSSTILAKMQIDIKQAHIGLVLLS